VSSGWLVALGLGVLPVLLVGFLVWFSLQLLAQNGRIFARLEAIEMLILRHWQAPLLSRGRILLRRNLLQARQLSQRSVRNALHLCRAVLRSWGWDCNSPGTQCCIAEGAATGPCCPMGSENVNYGVSVCHQNTDGNPDGRCCPPGQGSYPCNVGPPATFRCCPVSRTASGGCCEYPPGTYTCCAPNQTCQVPSAFGSPPYGCV
jgi:hypothetical protein